MLRRYGRNIAAALGLAVAMSVAGQAAVTNFSTDVASAIDASLQYFRTNNYFTTGGNVTAQGLVLLALLEKHGSPDFNAPIVGYTGLSGSDGVLMGTTYPAGCTPTAAGCPTGDKLLAQYAVQRILNYDPFGQYAYYDGNFMMALSEYLRTGGQPNVPNTMGFATVKDKIDKLVDRTLAAQCAGDPTAATVGPGFWNYSGCGHDASTTQYAAGGLAASRDFYTFNGTDAARVASIGTALANVRSGYSHHFGMTGPSAIGTEGGWGYQVNNGAGHQQTASGMWISELAGADINDNAIQQAIRFERNHYQYSDNNTNGQSWPSLSYGYHLYSSSKAFTILDTASTVPNAGNTTPTDLGADPAAGDRAHRRDPTTDGCARLANFGVAGCAGGASPTPYSGETPRWYYDYAYTILSRQLSTGQHDGPDGGGWEAVSNQAYFTLVLQRSLGGVNAAPNCNAANTYVEVAMDAAHTYHDITIGPITDPDGDVITVTVDAVRMDEPDQWGVTFPFPATILAPNGVKTVPGGGTVNGLVQVRGERDGLRQSPGNGRVYHILFTANDGAGGTCHGEAKVGVRFYASQPPVDDYPGMNFNALLANPQ
jgi:hypothetical protein